MGKKSFFVGTGAAQSVVTAAEDDMTLKGRIHIQMAAHGIRNQSELARRLRVHRQTVSKWMAGGPTKLEPANLFALAEVLRCNPRWLALGPPAPPQPPVIIDPDRHALLELYDRFGENSKLRDSWIRHGRELAGEEPPSSKTPSRPVPAETTPLGK